MGYESRLYIVNHHNRVGRDAWNEEIARIDMGKMGGFGGLFTKNLTGILYSDDRNTPLLVDSYDEPLRYAALDDVIKWVNKVDSESVLTYSRFIILKALLNSVKETMENNIWIVHYGY